MYQEHYQLKELPFSLTPDTDFFYHYDSHQEALNVLRVALQSGEGFIKVSGEIGTGKTLICRKLLASLGDHYETAYIPNPGLPAQGLYMALAEELKIQFKDNANQHHLLKQINQKLMAIAAIGKQTVLIIDEAQVLSQEGLETIRLLTNFETEKNKLLQVVLFGQPELDRKLNHYSLRQLKQRITFSYRLRPFDKNSLEGYIGYRLQIAGYNGPPIFSHQALAATFKYSKGIPRVVNIICHKALMAAYGLGEKTITRRHIKLAAIDTEFINDQQSPLHPYAVTLLGITASLIAGVTMAYFVV